MIWPPEEFAKADTSLHISSAFSLQRASDVLYSSVRPSSKPLASTNFRSSNDLILRNSAKIAPAEVDADYGVSVGMSKAMTVSCSSRLWSDGFPNRHRKEVSVRFGKVRFRCGC